MKSVGPQILAVVRASPLRDRTAALLESIAAQKAGEAVRVVVLFQTRAAPGLWLPDAGVEYLQARPDWVTQALQLAEASGCRWLVLPSSVDRYLPGAFETVLQLGASPGRTVVGACQIVRGGEIVRIGPDPFRFDYFALLSGWNYVAPGATFIDIDQCRRAGGLDVRFSSCAIYEYLLRTGAADGVDCCPGPLVETEAEPFPGIPGDWAALHASEALLVTLNYNRFFVTSGAALGLLAALADRLEPYEHMGFHDAAVTNRLTGAAAELTHRYLEELKIPAPLAADSLRGPDGAEPAGPSDQSLVAGLRARVKPRVKRVMPRPIWDLLRRAKRAYLAFRSPLY
jgi:hypothetical protein